MRTGLEDEDPFTAWLRENGLEWSNRALYFERYLNETSGWTTTPTTDTGQE